MAKKYISDKFVVNGGTSSQFLKGDGSLDTYTGKTEEEIRDIAATQWVDGANTTVIVDDESDTIKIDVAGDLTFNFNQGIASSTWTIAHNLGKFPSVSIIDNGNTAVEGEVIYIDNNNLTVNFSSAFAGDAYLN